MNEDNSEILKSEMEDFHIKKTIQEAARAYEEKSYDNASELFTNLIEKSEVQDVEWLVKRCLCYQNLNKDKEAMHDAKVIVIRHPENYKGYSLLGALHQIQGRYDEALYCYVDCLEILWLSGVHQDRPDVSEKCLNDIIRSARPITELPENINKQSILTQLYILGNCFRREVHHPLAVRSLEVAIIVLERMKSASDDEEAAAESDNLKMKIYFVLAQCQQATGKFQECIENFKTSLGVALRLGDVSYETKAYSSLSALCLDQDRHAEAASYYIRLLAIGDDVLLAVGNDNEKFREHWSMEMEANILLNLCIAFKSMRLYDEAIHFALRYNTLVGKVYGATPTPEGFRSQIDDFRAKSVPIFEYKKSPFAQKSVDLSGILQSKFILGDLHELKGDFDSAMRYYDEWMKMSEIMSKNIPAAGGGSNPYLLDTASAYSCKGSVSLKKKQYNSALECFKQQANIGRITKIPPLQMEAALSKGDALIAMGRMEEAKDAYNFALKLSRQFMDDLEPECMCMWKVASIFAAEHRYTHAAYYCEQAVSLATKCGRNSVLMKLKFELALYYQHSTSTKELQKAAEIMYEMIKFQESHLHRQKLSGGKYFFEEESMLNRCYDAIQVILHKLRYHEASAAFAEVSRRRRFVALLKNKPVIPRLPDFTEVETEKENPKEGNQNFEDENEDYEILDCKCFLPHNLPENSAVLSYNLCESGFLAQFIRPGIGVVKSYLSSDYDIKPFATRGTIEALVEHIGKMTTTNEQVASHLCNVYNTEQRCLPKKNRGHRVQLPKIVQTKPIKEGHGGSGDHLISKVKVGSTEIASGGDITIEQCESDKKEISALEKLYKILILPMKDALEQLEIQENNLFIIADKDLDKIPFDALTDPSSGRCLGDKYNISFLPSLLMISPKKISECPPKPERLSESKKSSRKTTAARSRPKSRRSPRPQTSGSPRRSLDKEIRDFRENELMKSFGEKSSIVSLELAGVTSSMNKLVTKTATGTNVITSPRYIPPFKQVTKPLKCSVIGAPDLPDALKLRDEIWNPISQLPVAMKECKSIAEYMDVTPVVGGEATKYKFLKEIESSTLLHIASYADLEKGLLAFSPDKFPNIESPANEESYLVTAEEISKLKLDNLELVVLSSGQGWSHSSKDTLKVMEVDSFRHSYLTSALLLAGTSCVVQNLWSVPDSISSLFFYHFYNSLQTSSSISHAVRQAKDVVKEKYKDPAYWAGFVAYGRDVHVDLSVIRRAQLHASLDLVEAERLNIKPTVEDVVKPDIAMENLQKHFSRLAGHLSLDPMNRDVVGVLIEILEEAMDRLTADSNTDRPFVMLPLEIARLDGALGLLEELGFDFQPASLPAHAPHPGGISSYPNYVPGQHDPAVVFPHWNKDGLLLPAHQALTGLQDICNSDSALQCLARIFPLSQSNLCSMIDLLAVTRHTPEVQLRVQDMGVSTLWNILGIRKYLLEIGFMPVHSLIVFYKTSRHRTLLIASLQLLASLCLYRDQTILERLNIESLGTTPPSKTLEIVRKNVQTLRPIILPRKEVVLGASWMSELPSSDEVKERKNIAQRLSLAAEKYRRAIRHAKWWHKNLLIPQAQIKLSEFGLEKKTKPLKRKVKGGATPSCERVSVDGDDDIDKRGPQIILAEVSRKRDHAHYLAQKRCDDLEARLKAEVHQIYKEYAVNRQ